MGGRVPLGRKERSVCRKQEVSNQGKKEPRLMIKLLVKEVILYDDKVEIYYNCIDKKGPDDLQH